MNEQTDKRSGRRILTGKVLSDKMDKTVIVGVQKFSRHHLYKKAIRRIRRYPAQCELSGVAVGDTVKIREIRPLSRTKHFEVIEKVSA